MRPQVLAPALAVLVAGCATKHEPAPEPTPPEPEPAPSMWTHVSTEPLLGELSVERYTLTTNDLELLLVIDPSAPTFSYHTYFDVGSGDEEDGITGIAHLFEHMMFKRTDAYDDSHFSKVLEEAGTPDLNAWTWADITAYHASLGKEHLPLLADLEATRMDGLVIDEGQLNSEREVVINERRYRVDDDPEGLIDEQLSALAWTETRYHWSTIGWRKDLDRITVEDCNAFYKSFYAPNNATLVLVGDLDRDATLALLEEKYSGIPASTLERRPHGEEPEQTEPRSREMEVAAESELFTMGYKVPPLAHADTPALMLVDAILSAGNSSRLERKLVDGGLASSFSMFLPPFQHDSLFQITANMRQGEPASAAIQVVRDEMAHLRDNVVSEQELERARAQLLSHLYDELEGNSGIAGFLGFNEVATGSWSTGLQRIEAVKAVTPADVQRVAQAYLVDAHSSVVIGKPKGGKAARHKGKLPKAGPPEVPEIAKIMGRPLEGAPPMEVGAVEERETGGWTRLMVWDPTVPKVWFRLVLPFGAAVEEDGQLGITNLTAELLLRGTEDRDRDAFEAALEGLGASVSVDVTADEVTVAGSVLSAHWPELASLLSEALSRPAFDAEAFDDLVDEVKADLVESRNNDRWLGWSFYERGLWAGHPYGRNVLGTTKTLDALSAEDVAAWYRAWFGSQGAVLALLGDFDAGAGSDLARLAGQLPARDVTVPTFEAPEPPTDRRVTLVAKPDRSQLQIHLGHFAPRHDDAAYPATWLANEVFGGHGFGARMMSEIREKNGYSYGAYGSFSHERDGSTYTMWIFPAQEQAEPALKLLLSLYEDFARDGITADELTYARGAILNSAAFYTDTPRKRLAYEVRKRTRGLDPLAVLPAVREASLEEVNAAASQVFTPGAFLGTVVAPKEFLPTLQEVFGADAVTVVPYDAE